MYNVTIPPNSTATLYLKGNFSVSEGNPLSSVSKNDIAGTRKVNEIILGAGNYVFLIEDSGS